VAVAYKLKLAKKPHLTGLAGKYPDIFPVLLSSHSINQKTGRFSILMAKSANIEMAHDSKQLKALLNQFDRKIVAEKHQSEDDLPFYSGWFLYLSYASITAWEDSLSEIKQAEDQPLAIAIRCQSAIIIDHIKNKSWIVADSQTRVDKLARLLQLYLYQQIKSENELKVPTDDVQKYKENVKKAKDYIISGDVYQVNLARKWQIKPNNKVSAISLYQSLSKHNPAPFAGLLQTPQFSIISSSPERLVKVHANTIETRPIAGTRPRSKDKQKDRQLLEELLANPKEKAEHIMLIDLERNDIGKVSKTGSVKVDEFMVTESYAKVHHIVSNIKGQLLKNKTYYDVIKATFPGGTITGCPKIRCMQIIDELENSARGAYTGSMGYITDDGRMDLNILIRTIILVNNKLSIHAGAGIVYDSKAQKEAEESYFKAEALINSL
jgi:anthranilate synthase component 1